MASQLATQLNRNRILCIPDKETERVCERGVCLLGRRILMFMSVDLHFGAFLRLGTFSRLGVHLVLKLSFQY